MKTKNNNPRSISHSRKRTSKSNCNLTTLILTDIALQLSDNTFLSPKLARKMVEENIKGFNSKDRLVILDPNLV